MIHRANFKIRISNSLRNAVILLLSLAGIVFMLFATRWGIGLPAVSVSYIGMARNLRDVIFSDSHTFISASNCPPLLPLLLGGIGIFGIDPIITARWLNAFLFGGSIFLAGFIINKYTGSFWKAIAGLLLMMFSIDVLYWHAKAITEPLFIFLSLLGILLLSIFLDNRKTTFLVMASGVIGLAFLAKYTGIALVITALLGIFLFSDDTWKKRLRSSVIFCAISCSPMVLWLIRNIYVEGTATNRGLGFDPFTLRELDFVATVVSRWLFPKQPSTLVSYAILLIGVIIVGLVILRFILFERNNAYEKKYVSQNYLVKLPALISMFILIYTVFLLICYTFIEDGPLMEVRLILPIFAFGLILMLCLLKHLFLTVRNSRFLHVLCIALCVALFGFYLQFYLSRGFSWFLNEYRYGSEVGNPQWKNLEIIEQIRSFDSSIPVFTNLFHITFLLTGKNIQHLPGKMTFTSGYSYENNQDFSSQLDAMRERLRQENGVIVYFYAPYVIEHKGVIYPTEEELKEKLSLRLLVEEAEGAIYKISE